MFGHTYVYGATKVYCIMSAEVQPGRSFHRAGIFNFLLEPGRFGPDKKSKKIPNIF